MLKINHVVYRALGTSGVADKSKSRGVALLLAVSIATITLGLAESSSAQQSEGPRGTISTVAGTGTSGYSGDGGPATDASLHYPTGVAVDSAGNIYIADRWNNRIRKVDASGNISTVAGNGVRAYAGDGGPATSASLNWPMGVAVDSTGNIYIADSGNNRIRKVDTSGIISTVAGNGTGAYSGDGGPATSASLGPTSVTFDSLGNMYIADQWNHRIRKVDTSGIISTVAGNGVRAYAGDGGPATDASLHYPSGVALDSAGNIYIADKDNDRIRKVDTSGIISTVAGGGTGARFLGDGGPATSASLDRPFGVALDSAGNIYIADTDNNRIRKVDTSGTISTVAGGSFSKIGPYVGDGLPATAAFLGRPMGVDITNGNLYIADTTHARIRKVHGKQSQAFPLSVQVERNVLRWNDLDADMYWVSDPDNNLLVPTTLPSFAHPALATGDNFHIQVTAIRDEAVIAVERLRGSTIVHDGSAGTNPSVQEGMELMAAMFVRTSPTAVEFELPSALEGVVDGWQLYRNEALVETAGSGTVRIIDTPGAPAFESITYTVQLLAPSWQSAYEDSMEWIPALGESCDGEDETQCSPDVNPPNASGPGDSEFTTEPLSGDLLTFVLPIEIPAMTDPAGELPGSPGMSRSSSSLADSPSSNPDSFIWHETFIPENYVDAPDGSCCGTDFWFKGDGRGFTQYPNSATTRSKVRLRMDWSARKLYYSRVIAVVKRYENNGHCDYDNASCDFESKKKGVWETFGVHYVNRNGPCDSRCRLHIRHGAQNPYEIWYGAIDYEWEYVVTKDGGITARGMHDGAPNYQTFYQPRGSSGVGIGYTFTRTNYESLAWPMDWRDRTWCLYGCPTWGTSYWV